MNLPTLLLSLLILAVLVAIAARGAYNRKHGKSSCSHGGSCAGCPGSRACHPEEK